METHSNIIPKINKTYHFSINPNQVCTICQRHVIHYYFQDLPTLKTHCKNVIDVLQLYLSPDPTHIIASYISDPGWQCHYCETRSNIIKQLLAILKESDIYHHSATTFDSCTDFLHTVDKYFEEEDDKKFFVLKVGEKRLKCETFCVASHIFWLLIDIGVFRKQYDWDNKGYYTYNSIMSVKNASTAQ